MAATAVRWDPGAGCVRSAGAPRGYSEARQGEGHRARCTPPRGRLLSSRALDAARQARARHSTLTGGGHVLESCPDVPRPPPTPAHRRCDSWGLAAPEASTACLL